MSFFRLILASLLHHWRTHFAVALGVGAGTAVLTGALVVGSSMRGSLRHLTLDRLGRIDEVLLAQRFFRAELAEELAAESGFDEHFTDAVPIILLRAGFETTVETGEADPPTRAGRVHLLGCDADFWSLAGGTPITPPERGEVVLNEPLARRLGFEQPDEAVGLAVIVRLPQVSSVPSDTPLGRKRETVRSARLTVTQVIPAAGLGRFSLTSSQQQPSNAYVALDWLQRRLDRADRVNAILVASAQSDVDPTPESEGMAQELLAPTLNDYGLRVERTELDYFNITSDRVVLDRSVESALVDALGQADAQPALVYLANSIACGDREVPYSTVAAVDMSAGPAGPLLDLDGAVIGPLEDDQIVLNAWAAEDLDAAVGDTIRLTYFEPDSTDGQVLERAAEFRLAAVARLEGPASDRAFTPTVPGVTDQLSIGDWDPPFPFDAKRIRDKDEDYWDDHGATPKAFVSLAAGRVLFAGRFGQSTSLRISSENQTQVQRLEEPGVINPADMGFVFQAVKRQGLTASSGTTPFDGLFFGLSLFVIAAAVMLVALLFGLGIDQRAEQLGILAAVGFSRRRTARLLAAEGFVVSALGSLAGVLVGIGYGGLMLVGLRTWWLGAIVTPFLRLHVSPASLVIGYVGGVVVASAAIRFSVWRARRLAPRQLLSGQTETAGRRWSSSRDGVLACVGVLLMLSAGCLVSAAAGFSEATQVGVFFGAGSLALAGCLTLTWSWFRLGAFGFARKPSVGRLVLQNMARRPTRAVLTIGLVAATSFLVVAMSAFQLDPGNRPPSRESGDGGYALVMESDHPIVFDMNTPEGRFELSFSEDDSGLLDESNTTVHALRVRSGDNASCLNLYRPRQPRILGLPEAMLERGGFPWANAADDRENPWLLLEEELDPDEDGTPRVPVVLDKTTAMYSLQLYGGVGQTVDVTDQRGRTARLVIVGLLGNSIFQGDLLISQRAMLRIFPEVGGPRFFLVENDAERTGQVAAALERDLGDFALSTEMTGDRLNRLMSVQNTYLSTFQSLGALGLLLGTFGLAAVQLRNVLERRGELALLRATGFRRSTLAGMVLLETLLLLFVGLAVGSASAVIAIFPHLAAGVARLPVTTLAITLATVPIIGLFSGLAAARATLKAPLVSSLRGD